MRWSSFFLSYFFSLCMVLPCSCFQTLCMNAFFELSVDPSLQLAGGPELTLVLLLLLLLLVYVPEERLSLLSSLFLFGLVFDFFTFPVSGVVYFNLSFCDSFEFFDFTILLVFFRYFLSCIFLSLLESSVSSSADDS
jgi:hypothetical protein